MSEYSVKINRRDGALEVAGDKDWVDQKLRELAPVFQAPIEVETGDDSRTGTPVAPTRRRQTASRSKQRGNGQGKQLRRRKTARPQKNADLATKLTSPIKQKLQEYRDARSAAFNAKATHAAAIIAGFLRDELDVTEIGEDELYTVYSVMGWRAPNVRSALVNAYERDKFFGGATEGKRELTQSGETFARHGAVNGA